MKKHAMKMWMVVGAATMMAANLSVADAAAKASSGNKTLTVYISGDVNIQGLWQNQLIPMYEKANPGVQLKLVFSAHGINDASVTDKIIAAEKAKQNSGYDILEGLNVTQLTAAHMLQKLTAKEVPNLSRIEPDLLKQTSYTAMPYRASSVVLAYNSSFVSNPPTTLRGLISWIQQNPGKFAYNQEGTGGSGDAFVRAIVDSKMVKSVQKEMVTGGQASLEKYWTPGLKLLSSLNADMYQSGYYPNGNTGTLNLLANQSIWMAPVWSDMALTALATKQLPPTVKLVQLNPPFSGGPADVSIVKNSPNKVAAEKFFNWILTPKVQGVIVNTINGYPGVEWKYVPKSIQVKYAAIAKAYGQGWGVPYSSDIVQQWQNKVPAKTGN